MTNEERAERLALARNLILEVRESFPNEKETCECCGFVKFKDWNHKQLRDQLSGAVHRLEVVYERMVRTDGVERHRYKD